MKDKIDDLNTIYRLSPEIRSALWKAFTLAYRDEVKLMIKKFEEKLSIYNVDEMTYEQLLEVSELLGVPFNANVNNSVEFIREEVRAIPFKIKYKDTVLAYDSFFKSLGYKGQTYAYYYRPSSSAIIRGLSNPLLLLPTHDVKEPLIQKGEYNFTGVDQKVLLLDDSLRLDIESAGEYWKLDTVESSVTSNHIGSEVLLDKIWTKEVPDPTNTMESIEKEFLMIWEGMDFLQVNIDFSRRVVAVPHVGCHMTLLTDSTGNADCKTPGEHTHPKIKTDFLVNPEVHNALSSVHDVTRIEFGIGSNSELKKSDGSGSFPKGLAQRVARVEPYYDEKFENKDWRVIYGGYKGQSISDFILHDQTGYVGIEGDGTGACDGSNNKFTGVLPFAPLKRGNVQFSFVSGAQSYEIQDDGKGLLYGNGAQGEIDYDTGEYELDMDFIYKRSHTGLIGDDEETEFDIELPIENTISHESGKQSLLLFYDLDKRYNAVDDGDGNLIGRHLLPGSTINYTTGVVHLKFDQVISEETKVICSYEYPKTVTPNSGTRIKAEYYFTQVTIEITEAGIFDKNGDMLGYATFPPVEFNSNRSSFNIGFGMKKTPFE